MKELNTDFQSAFDGLMLGDGCVSKWSNSKNCFYTQVCKYKEWLDSIGQLLDINGFKNRIYLCKTSTSAWTTSMYYRLDSRNSVFFTDQRKRWYKEWYPDPDESLVKYKKAVPRDIELTPECVANWYMGDGSVDVRKYRNYQIRLFTDGFEKDDVDFLVFLLNDQVVDCARTYCRRGSKHYIILSKKSGVREFLDYVRPYIVPCFSYKIPEVS